MSKEVNGSYSDYDRQWLEMVAGKRRGEIHEWDNLLSNAMANRILDRIAELESQVENLQASLSNACGEIVRLKDDINLLAPAWTKEEDWSDE